MMDNTNHENVGATLTHCHSAATALQQALFETRTSKSLIRPSTADTHPPGVPDAIATRTPIAAGKYHVVLPQGKEWESTRPHAVWHAYDGRIEAFLHPSTPDETDWWLILQKPFDGRTWGHGPSCVARNAAQAGEIISSFLHGNRDAIRTARNELPPHATSATETVTPTDTEADSAQNTIEEFK